MYEIEEFGEVYPTYIFEDEAKISIYLHLIIYQLLGKLIKLIS